jgi:hypothetical protein
VGDPRIGPIYDLLQLLLQEGEDGARDDAADATAVDAQHGDDALLPYDGGGDRGVDGDSSDLPRLSTRCITGFNVSDPLLCSGVCTGAMEKEKKKKH